MKAFGLTVFLSLIIPALGMAQDLDEKNEKIQAQKVAFITEKLKLTPREAQVFWPIYNEYQDKQNKIVAQRKSTREYYRENSDNLTDKEISDILDKYVALQQKELDLFKEYNEKFKTALPPNKVMKLYLADTEFKAWLINQLRGNSQVKPRANR
jgi:hypothetical protein